MSPYAPANAPRATVHPMASAAKRRAFPAADPLTRYAVKRIEEWLTAEPKRTASELARMARIRDATISDIRGGKKRLGPDSGPGLAAAFGMSYSGFVEAAEREFGHVRSLREVPVERPRADRYEVMALIRQAAKADGIPAEFVERFEAKLDFDGQPKFGDIWDLLIATWRITRGKASVKRADPDEF